jgi:radical SAM superfamily enzyme YgiQ (UPF0313 family)
MRYEGNIYRPPSEWQSYILQVTIGCSHNACTFCGMFKDKRYRVRPLQDILDDIDMAKAYYGHLDQIFLSDGDAISLSTDDLLKILKKIKETFPEVKEIATYASAKGTLDKSPEELAALRKAGLTKAYLGVESGDDKVLKDTHKGVDAAQMAQAGRALVDAGIELYAIILIGLAGQERSHQHAKASAEIINTIKPQHLAAMTYTPVPGTPLFRDIQNGKFQVLSDAQGLEETRLLIEGLDDRKMHFTSSHVSNRVNLEGDIHTDKEKMLKQLENGIKEASVFERTGPRRL